MGGLAQSLRSHAGWTIQYDAEQLRQSRLVYQPCSFKDTLRYCSMVFILGSIVAFECSDGNVQGPPTPHSVAQKEFWKICRRDVPVVGQAPDDAPRTLVARSSLGFVVWSSVRSVGSSSVLMGCVSLIHSVAIGRARRFIRFCLVGASGPAVNTLLLSVLVQVGGWNPIVAATVATEVAILSNFALNDRWTFSEAQPGTPWVERAARYNAVALGGLAIPFTL